MYKTKLGFMIYRVSWERYDDEGCYEEFYTDWTIDIELAQSQMREIIELAKVNKKIIAGDIIKEFVTCTQEELNDIIGKAFPLKEEV